MFSSDSINIISFIDEDIIINETVYKDIFQYVENIVQKYKEYKIIIFLQLTIFDNIIDIKIFDNT